MYQLMYCSQHGLQQKSVGALPLRVALPHQLTATLWVGWPAQAQDVGTVCLVSLGLQALPQPRALRRVQGHQIALL
jgi:hypothetical protein